jgi:ElaA protein
MYQKSFAQLTHLELYAILKLRQQVFIIEQQSIYQDIDDEDQDAMHYLDFSQAGELHRYARYRLDAEQQQVKIERVVLAKTQRKQGKGKELMLRLLKDIAFAHPNVPVKLSSQFEAQGFYQGLGFVAQGQPYDDGGILHVDMLLQATG